MICLCFLLLVLQFMYHINFNDISSSGVVDLPMSARMMLDEMDQALADGGHPSRKSAHGTANIAQIV
jgi:hypothetical protein